MTMTAAIGAALLFACGNRPAEQAQAPAAPPPPQAAAPAAAPPPAPASATPPAGSQVAHAPPLAAPQETATPKPTPKPKPKAEPPPPPPKPQPIAKTLPAGTDLNVELVDAASSRTSQVGAAVRARVTQALVIDGLTVIPQGAIVHGTVTEAVPLKKIGGAASLGLRFDSIDLGGGALLGRLLSDHDKTKGTLIGAAVGAAAGTGVAAATKGQEVELPAGTALALHLEQPLTVTVQP
jgi:hypothetical protein